MVKIQKVNIIKRHYLEMHGVFKSNSREREANSWTLLSLLVKRLSMTAGQRNSPILPSNYLVTLLYSSKDILFDADSYVHLRIAASFNQNMRILFYVLFHFAAVYILGGYSTCHDCNYFN